MEKIDKYEKPIAKTSINSFGITFFLKDVGRYRTRLNGNKLNIGFIKSKKNIKYLQELQLYIKCKDFTYQFAEWDKSKSPTMQNEICLWLKIEDVKKLAQFINDFLIMNNDKGV